MSLIQIIGVYIQFNQMGNISLIRANQCQLIFCSAARIGLLFDIVFLIIQLMFHSKYMATKCKTDDKNVIEGTL